MPSRRRRHAYSSVPISRRHRSARTRRAAADRRLGRRAVAARDRFVGSVTFTPTATLACPLVSALDQWFATAVQPAAMRWFGQPVVEVRQISAYSCRGMNGNPARTISEHAFGNALDIASFTLADGRRVTVKNGWRGSPEEQGFLRDVQASACDRFTTVLAPGSNRFHADHFHVDLMRRARRQSLQPPRGVGRGGRRARARAIRAAGPRSVVHRFGSQGDQAGAASRPPLRRTRSVTSCGSRFPARMARTELRKRDCEGGGGEGRGGRGGEERGRGERGGEEEGGGEGGRGREEGRGGRGRAGQGGAS